MKLATMVIGLALLFAWQSDAQAQMLFGGSRVLNDRSAALNWLFNRPTVSPYVNLLRTDNVSGGAMNYHQLVRPQLEARRRAALQDQREQQARMQRARYAYSSLARPSTDLVAGRDPRMRIPTGHVSQFLSYSHYFPMMPGQR